MVSVSRVYVVYMYVSDIYKILHTDTVLKLYQSLEEIAFRYFIAIITYNGNLLEKKEAMDVYCIYRI